MTIGIKIEDIHIIHPAESVKLVVKLFRLNFMLGECFSISSKALKSVMVGVISLEVEVSLDRLPCADFINPTLKWQFALC